MSWLLFESGNLAREPHCLVGTVATDEGVRTLLTAVFISPTVSWLVFLVLLLSMSKLSSACSLLLAVLGLAVARQATQRLQTQALFLRCLLLLQGTWSGVQAR